MSESKVSKLKREFGYRKQGPNCGNCIEFKSLIEKIKSKDLIWSYEKETKKRCGLGGFAIVKSSWCEKHQWREG